MLVDQHWSSFAEVGVSGFSGRGPSLPWKQLQYLYTPTREVIYRFFWIRNFHCILFNVYDQTELIMLTRKEIILKKSLLLKTIFFIRQKSHVLKYMGIVYIGECLILSKEKLERKRVCVCTRYGDSPVVLTFFCRLTGFYVSIIWRWQGFLEYTLFKICRFLN